ncbi:MAG: hypothetical protein ACSW8I_01240 [bacterium]
MKRLSILFVAFAAMVLTSCSMLGGASGSSAAQATGQTCGSALLGLYQAYQSTGKIDLTNANNLTNALTLATCYTQIKQNKNNASYKKSFGDGLVLSSAGLITSQNSNAFINTLVNANGLATMASTAANGGNAAAYAPVITSLIQALGTK